MAFEDYYYEGGIYSLRMIINAEMVFLVKTNSIN